MSWVCRYLSVYDRKRAGRLLLSAKGSGPSMPRWEPIWKRLSFISPNLGWVVFQLAGELHEKLPDTNAETKRFLISFRSLSAKWTWTIRCCLLRFETSRAMTNVLFLLNSSIIPRPTWDNRSSVRPQMDWHPETPSSRPRFRLCWN